MSEDIMLKMSETLTNMEKEVGKKVAGLEATGKNTSEEISGLKKVLEEVKEEVASVQKQIIEKKKMALPGLQEGKEIFSLQMYIQAQHNIMRSVSDPWKNSGIEYEACKQWKERAGAQSVTEPTSGGYLIGEEVSKEVMDLAVAQMPIYGLGVTRYAGLVGDFSIPRKTSKPTAYWIGEAGKPTLSQTSLGKIFLRRKKIGAFAKVTKDLIYQSRGVADTMIKQDLAEALALGMHNAFINGTGTNFQPLGLLNLTANTATVPGYTTITEQTNGAVLKFDGAIRMIQALAEANYLKDSGKFGFLANPTVKYGLARQNVEMYSGQSNANGLPIFAPALGLPFLTDAEIDAKVRYPFKTTTQISKTLTKGTSTTCSSLIFGDWANMAIAEWLGFELKVSDQAGDGSTGSAFLDDEMYMVAFQSVDCGYPRPESFVIRKDLETSGLAA